LLEAFEADRGDVVEQTRPEQAVPTPPSEEQLEAAIAKLASAPAENLIPEPAEFEPPAAAPVEAEQSYSVESRRSPERLAMSETEKAALSKRLERLAEQSLETSQTEATWELDGQQYSAVLIHEPANDGSSLERVIAQVSTSDRGKHLTTIVNLRRLAFSQFTQMVNLWDPLVQMHDDEIVGRFHSNSQLKLLYDSRTAPKFTGKVTTAARGFDTESHARRRQSDIFQGGVETRAGRIKWPESPEPFEWAPMDKDARIHEFNSDAHIRFYRDGSYTWTTRETLEPEYVDSSSGHSVYFVAAPGVTLYVQGVVAGKVLVYSPLRIVIEGHLKYANNPRNDSESGDFVGLVSDRYVEVAPPSVTGSGDLDIEAAIFAGRRFIVSTINYPRTSTLRIYGSLAAGTLTATEPRYATKIEYDSRFERQRPPGFPSTNRFETASWDGQWTEASTQSFNDSP